MKRFEIPKGTTIYWGAPAKPMPEDRSHAVAQLVANTPGIVEAHLPQCYAEGVVDPPAQVLVIAFSRDADQPAIMQALAQGISHIFPPGEHLDILPESDRGTLQTIRQFHVQIYASGVSDPQPWWRRLFSYGDPEA